MWITNKAILKIFIQNLKQFANKLKLLNKIFRNYKVYFLHLGTEFYFSVHN